MTDYGIKASKDGKSVKTDDDIDMSLSSKYSNLTVYKTGTVSVATSARISIPAFVLPNIPIFLVWFKGYGDTKWYPVPTLGTWHSSEHHVETWIGFDINLGYGLLFYTNCDGGQNDTFKYIIFNEKIQSS